MGHGFCVDYWGLGMIVYEMMTGLPPWYTTDRAKLFRRLRSAPLDIPSYFSSPSASFCAALLERNPRRPQGPHLPPAPGLRRPHRRALDAARRAPLRRGLTLRARPPGTLSGASVDPDRSAAPRGCRSRHSSRPTPDAEVCRPPTPRRRCGSRGRPGRASEGGSRHTPGRTPAPPWWPIRCTAPGECATWTA